VIVQSNSLVSAAALHWSEAATSSGQQSRTPESQVLRGRGAGGQGQKDSKKEKKERMMSDMGMEGGRARERGRGEGRDGASSDGEQTARTRGPLDLRVLGLLAGGDRV